MLDSLVKFIRHAPGVYQFRRAKYKRRFFSGTTLMWGLWGDYPSMEHARAEFPDRAVTTYDSDAVVDINIEWFSQVSMFDYPVMYWLSRLLEHREGGRLVDFGGHVGVKYYAYRQYLRLPAGFEWQVVDVPAMVRRGRERAEQQGAAELRFFCDIAEAQEADLLFCSGSLQYSELRIDDIVRRMRKKPQHLVINKLGVLPSDEVVTLENFGVSWIPYRIQSLERFKASLAAIGYQLVDEWEIAERRYSVPFVEKARQVMNVGQVWKLNHAPDTVRPEDAHNEELA